MTGCVDPPTDASPLWLQCPTCRGIGCELCDNSRRRGHIAITSCPRDQVTPDIWQAFEAERLARHGSWPNEGGWLDQPRVLLDCMSCIRASEARMKINHTDDDE